MPKKDKKSGKKKDGGRDPADVVEAVRGAVERTFQATTGGTEGARDRGRNLLDDVTTAAQRIRESFDDLRVLEDVRGLRVEIEALSRRVAELEKQSAKSAAAGATTRKPAAPRKPAAKATAAKTTASGTSGKAPAKTAPSGAAAKRPSKAPVKASAAGTAAAKTGPKPKPKSASARGKSG